MVQRLLELPLLRPFLMYLDTSIYLSLVLSRLHLETIVNLTYTPAHLAEVKKNKVCGKKDFFFYPKFKACGSVLSVAPEI